MQKIIVGTAALWALLLAGGTSQVHAQAFGARTLGGGLSGPTSGGAFGSNTTNSAFGSTSMNNSRSATTGSNGMNNGQLGQQTGQGTAAQLGQAGEIGQNAYARSRQGQFVGADRGDSADNPLSQANAINTQMNTAVLNQLQQRMRQNQQNLTRLNQQQEQGQNQKTRLRIPLRLPPLERAPVFVSSKTTSQLARRLTKLPALSAQGPIEVVTEGHTVVLRGQVATETDRELAAEIVQLEPGVSVVRNELVVGPGVSTAAVSRPTTPAARRSQEF